MDVKINAAIVEAYKDSYEVGMTVEEMVEFFHDCQKSAPEDETFASLSADDLKKLAEAVIAINESKEDF